MAEAFNNFFTTIDPDLMVRYTKQVSNLSLTFVPLTKLFFFSPKSPKRYNDLHFVEWNKRKEGLWALLQK